MDCVCELEDVQLLHVLLNLICKPDFSDPDILMRLYQRAARLESFDCMTAILHKAKSEDVREWILGSRVSGLDFLKTIKYQALDLLGATSEWKQLVHPSKS